MYSCHVTHKPATAITLQTGGKWLCTLILALAQTAFAQTPPRPEIEYASPDQSVWTTRLNQRGEPDNPLLSLAAALFERAGIPWRANSYPAKRMFSYLQDGTAQFSMLVKAPALSECCLLSRKPVATAEIRVFHHADKAPIRKRDDLIGKSVITILGYSYGGLRAYIADEHHRVANSAAPTHATAFRMLVLGRADYVIDYAGPAAEVLAAEPLADVRSEVIDRQDVYLVLAKSYPDATNVMARLEAIAATLDIPAILQAHAKTRP